VRTRVVNIKKFDDDYIFIGRGSKWGNPYRIGKDGTREQVIEKYEDYIRKKPEMMADLPKLVGENLGCYCYPKKCHGDVLVKLIKERGLENEAKIRCIK
jgi:hypothetical protein